MLLNFTKPNDRYFCNISHKTNTSVIDFESNIPVTMLQDFLVKEDNRFDLKRFTEYVHSFKHVKNYFINIL